MSALKVVGASLMVGFMISFPATAGTYARVTDCDDTGCYQGQTDDLEPHDILPQSVTHPFVFEQAGGSFTLRVCPGAGEETGIPAALDWAVSTWNALEAIYGNCPKCVTWETAGSSSGDPSLASVLLHELGHCALGLGHPDRTWDAGGDGTHESTSYSSSYNVTSISPGSDFIRGSFDDQQLGPLGMPVHVTWFRKADNNPIIVDTTAIDTSTFSRSRTNLPSGHGWGANANAAVAASLGQGGTQAVMYSLSTAGAHTYGLSADEVNMVRMARTGVDLTLGTSDDYSVQLQVVDCTSPHEIQVVWTPLDPLVGGECSAGVQWAYEQNPFTARVLKMVPVSGSSKLFVRINQNLDWNTDIPAILFRDGFESGDFSEWSSVSP